MIRDFAKNEIEKLNNMTGKTFYKLKEQILNCFNETEGDIEIWNSNNFAHDDVKVLSISNSNIDKIWNLEYMLYEDEYNNTIFKVIKIWDINYEDIEDRVYIESLQKMEELDKYLNEIDKHLAEL